MDGMMKARMMPSVNQIPASARHQAGHDHDPHRLA